MKLLRPMLLFALACLLAPTHDLAAADAQTFEVTVEAGSIDRSNVPVRVSTPIAIDDLTKPQVVELKDDAGKTLPGQLTPPGIGSEDKEQTVLHFVVPQLKKGEKKVYKATVTQKADVTDAKSFKWVDTAGEHRDLLYGEKPVLRYMYKALDEKNREETYKPFHHVYDPAGKQIVTKGAGGQFTHHRGLFFGFNKVTYGDGKKADVWHASGKAYQSHEKFLSEETGPVMGRHLVQIDWHGQEGEVFATEQRELTVYAVPGGHLIEFASKVTPTEGTVKLDGDPQHAGFHFRASNEVAAKTAKQTIYIRPGGKGKPGQTINWTGPKSPAETVDQPWKGMSFVVGGERYTAAYLDHPKNPKQARFSERDYGRFGSYFEYEMTEEKPLRVNYRVWLQEGEMDGEAIAELATDFVQPPQASVSK